MGNHPDPMWVSHHKGIMIVQVVKAHIFQRGALDKYLGNKLISHGSSLSTTTLHQSQKNTCGKKAKKYTYYTPSFHTKVDNVMVLSARSQWVSQISWEGKSHLQHTAGSFFSDIWKLRILRILLKWSWHYLHIDTTFFKLSVTT